jgi:hypothetical protein
VLTGELTFNANGTDTVYKEGQSFVELPNQAVQARNAGTAPTRVMASFVIPKGAPLSTAHPAPAALPKTGAADPRTLSGWLVLVAVIGLMAGGWLRWRKHARAH